MFRFILLILILIVLTIGAYFWVYRVSIFERHLSRHFGTEVNIEEVRLAFDHLTLEGLRIGNPAPATLPYAFEGDITIQVSPFALWKRTLQIDRISFKDPILEVELYNNVGSDNNWARILSNLPKTRGGRHFVIGKLTIENLQFQAIRSNKKSFSIPPIPYLEFGNLGNAEPLSLSQVGRIIFQTILSTLTSKQYLGGLLDNVVLLPQNLLKGVESTLPLEERRDYIQESLDVLRRKTEEATDFIQGLFSN